MRRVGVLFVAAMLASVLLVFGISSAGASPEEAQEDATAEDAAADGSRLDASPTSGEFQARDITCRAGAFKPVRSGGSISGYGKYECSRSSDRVTLKLWVILDKWTRCCGWQPEAYEYRSCQGCKFISANTRHSCTKGTWRTRSQGQFLYLGRPYGNDRAISRTNYFSCS